MMIPEVKLLSTKDKYMRKIRRELSDGSDANDKISFLVLSCIRSLSVEFINDYVLRDTIYFANKMIVCKRRIRERM